MLTVIQNQGRVPLAAFERTLADHGISYRQVRLFEGDPLPEAAEVDALVVLGGTMGVHEADRFAWMTPLQRLMRAVAKNGTPLLGICLGGQLLAAALDGTVTSDSHGEHGMHQVTLTEAGNADPLFSGLPDPLPVMQWHGDSFDLPPGAESLAFSEACPVQAFRSANAYGLQFHPEVDKATVANWTRDRADSGQLVANFVAAAQQHGAAWQRLFVNFLQQAGLLRSPN